MPDSRGTGKADDSAIAVCYHVHISLSNQLRSWPVSARIMMDTSSEINRVSFYIVSCHC